METLPDFDSLEPITNSNQSLLQLVRFTLNSFKRKNIFEEEVVISITDLRKIHKFNKDLFFPMLQNIIIDLNLLLDNYNLHKLLRMNLLLMINEVTIYYEFKYEQYYYPTQLLVSLFCLANTECNEINDIIHITISNIINLISSIFDSTLIEELIKLVLDNKVIGKIAYNFLYSLLKLTDNSLIANSEYILDCYSKITELLYSSHKSKAIDLHRLMKEKIGEENFKQIIASNSYEKTMSGSFNLKMIIFELDRMSTPEN